MFTERISMRVPGIFAPSCSETPSLGCSVSTSWLGLHAERAVLAEGEMGNRLQRDRDLGDLACQALAGAQVEGDAGPAPVVDFQAQRRERLGRRARAHALLLEIARHVLAAGVPGGVLRAHGDLGDLRGPSARGSRAAP